MRDLGFFRIGGEEYTEENGTYGLATLRRGHVSLTRAWHDVRSSDINDYLHDAAAPPVRPAQPRVRRRKITLIGDMPIDDELRRAQGVRYAAPAPTVAWDTLWERPSC